MRRHHSIRKGSIVNRDNAGKHSAASGLSAKLAAVFRRAGANRPLWLCFRRVPLPVLLGVAVLSAPVVILSAPAPAAEVNGPPTIKFFALRGLRSTRAALELRILPNGLTTQATISIATSPAGPWTTVQTKSFPPLPAGESGDLEPISHHLEPATAYYLRAVVTNAAGTVTETKFTSELEHKAIPNAEFFTTHPILAPEFWKSTYDPMIENPPGVYSGGSAEHRFGCAVHTTSLECFSYLETNGAETHYEFAYSQSQGGPFTKFAVGGEGAVTKAEDFAEPTATATGLEPETTYYVRLDAVNSAGEVPFVIPFKTNSLYPQVTTVDVGNVTGVSARLSSNFYSGGLETKWRFEYTTEPENSLSWKPGPLAAGTISGSEADEEFANVNRTVSLTGLSPGTVYYVRAFAENEHGESRICTVAGGCEEPSTGSEHAVTAFETAGPPAVTTFATHALHGEAARALGAVDPGGAANDEEQTVSVGAAASEGSFTLSFEGETTSPIPFDYATVLKNEPGDAGKIVQALEALPSIGHGNVGVVVGADDRHYRIKFGGALGGRDLPPLTADGSALQPTAPVTVSTDLDGGPFRSTVRAQYVSASQFAKTGWAGAPSTSPVKLGDAHNATRRIGGHTVASFSTLLVGAELPQLQSGETYRYRLLAANETPGDPEVTGAEHSLTVPTPPSPGTGAAPCPNEALRTGLSAGLSDCRAYEQVTPVEKEGTTDIYPKEASSTQSLLGEDGEHLLLNTVFVHWGSDGDPLTPTYFFARQEGSGWQMTSAHPVGETSPSSYLPVLFTPDLTRAALEVGWKITPGNASKNIELQAGPPGGPYTAVATLSRALVHGTPWVGGSADLSKLVFRTEVRNLIAGHSSKTTSGYDLYEYSEGQLRQANVKTNGEKISSCGATAVSGIEPSHTFVNLGGSQHAVSADGSRVLFTDNCTGHLYMRVGGAETLDVGEYSFLAADAEDSKLLLERRSGEAHEYFLYETATATARHLFTTPHEQIESPFISKDFNVLYFESEEQLTAEAPPGFGDIYRYDIPSGKLRFILPKTAGNGKLAEPSADGRYALLAEAPEALLGAPGRYEYDSREEAIQCIVCGPTYPEPVSGEPAPEDNFGIGGAASDNGDYRFFTTNKAFVSQDVDAGRSATDVYEWRRAGVEGCALVQGCVSLISGGRGGGTGTVNLLLGTTPSGHDVFFASHERLAPSDSDNAGDVYDARIGGGFPIPPPGPVNCSGDACSTPPAAPSDQTPASFTFQGAGNLLAPAPAAPAAKPKPKAKKVCKPKGSKRCRAKAKHGAHRSSRKPAGRGRRS